MSRLWIVVVLAVVASACNGHAVESVQHGDFLVEKLFVEDGCTVYRFLDGTYRYFVKCGAPNTASTQWREYCGKGCNRDVDIHTATEYR